MTDASLPRRVAIVTGASRGLGRVLAGFLAGLGWEVIGTARGREELERAAEALRGKGGRLVSVPGDVTDPEHRQRLVETAGARGRLDLLVNNASDLGPSPLPPLARLSAEAFRRVLEVNSVAPLQLIQGCLPLLERSHGLVVTVTSDAASGGYPGWGAYGSSKAALELLTKTLAAELRDVGVSVVTVDPGDMRTEMHQDAYPGEDISDRPLPEVTLPFWAWLLGQDPAAVSGARFQAQAPVWEVPG